jgi:hypothetical protein
MGVVPLGELDSPFNYVPKATVILAEMTGLGAFHLLHGLSGAEITSHLPASHQV